jgi:hypothetical protein
MTSHSNQEDKFFSEMLIECDCCKSMKPIKEMKLLCEECRK